MKTPRIYQQGSWSLEQTVDLDPSAAQHVSAVLRMQIGDELTLFCGNNQEYTAIIIDHHKKKVTVKITEINYINRESPRSLHLAQVISKGERFEFVIQKAVELGVTSITPLISTRCVVRLDQQRMAKKILHWQALIVSACEQSGRNLLPILHSACNIETYLNQCNAAIRLILHPGTTSSWPKSLTPTDDIAIMIGPEGGFTTEEVQAAIEVDFKSLSLGPRILRTETATIAALSILQTLHGDM